MHIGISIPNLGPFCHPGAVAALAREAEAAGFEGFFICTTGSAEICLEEI